MFFYDELFDAFLWSIEKFGFGITSNYSTKSIAISFLLNYVLLEEKLYLTYTAVFYCRNIIYILVINIQEFSLLNIPSIKWNMTNVLI